MDLTLSLGLALIALAGLGVVTAAALRGWKGWLELKRLELQSHAALNGPAPAATMTSRIEIADLKERIRKLEAIAAGVDL